MASAFVRSASRVPLSSLRSLGARSRSAGRSFSIPVAAASSVSPSPVRRVSSLSRIPVELGCCGGSMLPLHSAVAAARMTSRLSTSSRSSRALSQGILCRTYPGL